MSEEIKTYTDTNWEDLLEYNGMTWINIDRFKSLQQKVEQLENIRKEVIEELSYMSTDAYVEDYDIREKHYNLLMNILNKGSKENASTN